MCVQNNQGEIMKSILLSLSLSILLCGTLSFATMKCESHSEIGTTIAVTLEGSLSHPERLQYAIHQDDQLIFQSPLISVDESWNGYLAGHLSGEKVLLYYYLKQGQVYFAQFAVFDPTPRSDYPHGYHYYGQTSSCSIN